jgi:pyruvate-formate lyase
MNMDSNERITMLRRRHLERKASRPQWHAPGPEADDSEQQPWLAKGPGPIDRARSLLASEGIVSWQLRQGLLTRDVLSNVEFEIDDLELLVGREIWEEAPSEEDMKEAEEYVSQFPDPPGQRGHCELDLDPIMAGGIDGLRKRIRELRLQCAGDAKKMATYDSFLFALEGLSNMIANAALAVEDSMKHSTESRRNELREIAGSCRRIVSGPPKTFRDAIQLLWFTTFGVMRGESIWMIGPGHLDRLLRPFYEADLTNGTITRDEALQLIECLYILENDYFPVSLTVPVMVGGRDADGHDETNELSYLSLEALRRTRLVYPTVGVCWHEGTPKGLVDLAIDIIAGGCANPAFFGDETIQRGLRSYGVPEREASRYLNSTCVEITPSFGSNVWVANPYFNVCQTLLEEIDEQVKSGPVEEFADFQAATRRRLAEHIRKGAEKENAFRRKRQLCGGKPLQSVFTRDCLERGRDIDDGGARYNWVECSFVGLANLADSLEVIRQEVFVEKRLSLGDMKSILDSNFEGSEPVRRRFLRRHAKYGNEDPGVDGLFAGLIDFVREECAKSSMEPDGSPFIPGAFAWIMHQWLGGKCGATPDGRLARKPFADGCGPAQGRESKGPTAAILSTTSWDHSPMLGGLAFNMKFSRSLMSSRRARECLRDLVMTYLHRGGFETQINVVDYETLRAARENPEGYEDLVVRIGGYTDYFTKLSPGMQDEVLMRTQYEMA